MACTDSGYAADIGEKRFSRVRPVDDEARKKRIFDTYSYCSMDVNGLNKQLAEKAWVKEKEDKEKKAYAEYQDMKNRNMKYYEEQVRLRRHENELEAAKEWTNQHKERVASDIQEKLWRMQINDRFGPFTRDRYLQQDLEPARDQAIYDKLQEKWCEQLDSAEARRKKDTEETMDYVHRQCIARKNMRERDEFGQGRAQSQSYVPDQTGVFCTVPNAESLILGAIQTATPLRQLHRVQYAPLKLHDCQDQFLSSGARFPSPFHG